MLSSFRRLSKSTVGSIVLVFFLVAILASFVLGDMANLGSNPFGMSGTTLAKAGSEEITDRELSDELERRLSQVRQQNPEASYAALAADFDPILATLIDQDSLSAFANDFGFNLSKKLIDAQIAQIPGTKGLDGKFSDAAYAAWLSQQRLTDQQVRRLIRNGVLQQMLLEPIAAGPRVPVGVATPYASMLLEGRQGEVAVVPIAAFRAGLNPTPADLQRFYASNRARYTVPEQRAIRIARIGPEQVAGVVASPQEVAAYYNANKDLYAVRDVRVISQALVPDKATADAIAARARGGAAFAAAAAPAGLSAEDISIGPKRRAEFGSLAGEKVASATFAAKAGEIVGPIQSDFGWHVVKVDSIRSEGGKSLDAARAEITTKLTADKRKAAVEAIIEKVQDDLDNGSNFQEAAAASKLPITQTPLILASGRSRQDANYQLPAEFASVLKSGFELEANDEPVIDTLPGEAGYALVAPAQVVAAAPAPLNQIQAQVASDWIDQQALSRARGVAAAIAAKAGRGVPLARAVAEAGTPLPAPRPLGLRRIDISMSREPVPDAVRMLFNLMPGKSRMVADKQNGALAVVKLNKIVPGNATLQPSLVAQVQRDFQQPVADEYARQFMAAVRSKVGVKRNESAISAARTRIIGS